MFQRCAVALVLLAGLVGAPPARAQDEAADFQFWSSVEARNTPDEYRAYLSQFPNGRFAALARIRLKAAPQAQPEAQPQPGPDPEADADVPHFSVTPPTGRVGQTYTVDCGTLPEGAGSSDVIAVVPAGSPSLDSTPPLLTPLIVFSQYTANCKSFNNTLPGFGSLPPGRWEFRWMTTLYNTQRRLETKAKVDLVVR